MSVQYEGECSDTYGIFVLGVKLALLTCVSYILLASQYPPLTPFLILYTESSINLEPPKTERSPSPPAQQPPQEDTPSETAHVKKEDTVDQSKKSEPTQETGDQ